MEKISSKRRAELRAEAHNLSATVHVGHLGLTASLLTSLDDALRTRELVKVQLGKTADLSVRDAAQQMAERMAAEVVQVIGRTATLYRHNPSLERIEGRVAWRTS